MARRRQPKQREEVWRLLLRLAVIAAIGGVLLAITGALTTAIAAFVFGACCALAAGWLLFRKGGHRAGMRGNRR
jgi:uncharacterized membrane protein YfcA